MIVTFPTLDVLRLALTSGAVPPNVAARPVRAALGEAGQVHVAADGALPRAAREELRRLGASFPRSVPTPPTEDLFCWPQLLPLEPRPGGPPPAESTPILFDLSADQLAVVAGEVLRLGNDRQAYRWLTDAAGTERALLRVTGPPYYTLLRALDGGTTAYAEAAPRVWVQLGHALPALGALQPPPGKWLLIRAPRRWELLGEAAFRDIYEVLEFVLPDAAPDWRETPLPRKLRVPLRLARSSSEEAAELWVLRDDPLGQLDALVNAADDALLRRSSFAVAGTGNDRVAVLRARPSRSGPPVIVVRGVGYRSYLHLPNLFLPCGSRLQPPLRREAVRRLLAEKPDQLTWLAPDGAGGFRAESLPDRAFRPLGDWVDYVLEQDRAALEAWAGAHVFHFEDFVVVEGPAEPREKKPRRERAARAEEESDGETEVVTEVPVIQAVPGPRPPRTEPEPELSEPERVEPGEAQRRLRELEERFQALEGPLDAPERRVLWPELARLHAALGNSDAGLCWLAALWEAERPATANPWAWFVAEAALVPRPTGERGGRRSWAAAAALSATGRELAPQDLDRALTLPAPTPADLRAFAAYLVWAGERPTPSAALVERLGTVSGWLLQHEHALPVRAGWLAWLAVARLSGGDVLALTRARDRLLERLYRQGLRPDLDLPGFLRFSSSGGGSETADWFHALHGRVVAWCRRTSGIVPGARTLPYVALIFAFAQARLGGMDRSRELLGEAEAELAEAGEVHSFLFQAFAYRVRQAQEGRPHQGPLPPEQMEYLQHLRDSHRDNKATSPAYLIDRLRSISRILEPDQEVNPYRHVYAQVSARDQELARLPDLIDRDALVAEVRRLLRHYRGGDPTVTPQLHLRVLEVAADQGPRAGEAFVGELLAEVLRVAEAGAGGPPDLLYVRGAVLEKSLFLAAHFDLAEHVPALLGHFERVLEALGTPTGLPVLATLASRGFRGLRKLGMRTEIERLLDGLAAILLGGRDPASVDAQELAAQPALLRAMLQILGGWYYFGRERAADGLLRTARAALFQAELTGIEQTKVPAAYAAALGQAPTATARRHVEELFQRVTALSDTYTTSPFYNRSQLELVEAAVLAFLGDDALLGAQTRRWLDEDEFLVRQRVHRDVR